MKLKLPTAVFAVVLLLLCGMVPSRLLAQPSASLTGKISDAAGSAVSRAKITAKNLATAQSFDTESNTQGSYTFTNLLPGDYEITASANSLSSGPAKVTIAAGQPQHADLALSSAPSQALPNAPSAAPQQAPSSSAPPSPSLSDLGFTPQQTQANMQLQAMLARHTQMLRIHQRLGLITTIPMAAAVITGPMAKAKGKNGEIIKEPTETNLDVHAALGGLTTALYFTTASYAIFAPRIPGNHKHGGIRWHEALAWVHGPGMIATPILGYMAYKQENSGEKAHGIAAQHGTVAYITAAAYGTSIVAVSWPIHWKFWEK